MLVKNVFMELRSRLRSCNVYITTGIDLGKDCNVKINIQANCIILNLYKDFKKRHDSLSSIESLSDFSEDESDTTSIQILEYCKIIPNSMSCLKIDKNTISFRILTEPKNGGNFYKELLTPKTGENLTKVSELKINVKTDIGIKIACANCSNIISNSVIKFERVLELPSANLDMSEWFCHGHCHGNSPQNDIVLKPNKNDFLHRHTFFVVNNTLLSEKVNKFNSKRDIYHCNRCLAWLGLKEKENIKMFNSEVTIQDNDAQKRVFSHKISIGDIPKDDFIYTIENVMREFDLGFQYTVMCKILLECKISTSKRQYLLIWVMDKELQVLRNKGEHILSDKIELQSTFLTKLLYKIELSLNDEVESWVADPAVVATDISKKMFDRGIEHLQEMSLKVPELFRNANGYFVSYLKV